MEIDGVLSALVVGAVLGLLARLVIPGRQPIGCLLTIVVGIAGAVAGAAAASSAGLSFWPTVALQVVIAAVLVALFSRLRRP